MKPRKIYEAVKGAKENAEAGLVNTGKKIRERAIYTKNELSTLKRVDPFGLSTLSGKKPHVSSK